MSGPRKVTNAAGDIRLAKARIAAAVNHLQSATTSHQPLPGGLELRANKLRRVDCRNLIDALEELATDVELAELRAKRERRRLPKREVA